MQQVALRGWCSAVGMQREHQTAAAATHCGRARAQPPVRWAPALRVSPCTVEGKVEMVHPFEDMRKEQAHGAGMYHSPVGSCMSAILTHVVHEAGAVSAFKHHGNCRKPVLAPLFPAPSKHGGRNYGWQAAGRRSLRNSRALRVAASHPLLIGCCTHPLPQLFLTIQCSLPGIVMS